MGALSRPRCRVGRAIVVLFSGGIASWGAARRLADDRGVDGMTLLFTDTMTEDADLYRFLDEAAADIGAPLVRLADGRDIWQVFEDERMLGNTRIDPCSRILKRELSRAWVTDHAPDAAIALGYDWTEVHRHERAVAAWAPRRVVSPLTVPPYRLRADLFADLEARGIRPPRLYAHGFDHNNCGGGCVKAGITHFLRLLDVLPAVYEDWERHEQALRVRLGDVSILRDRSGGSTRPLTLAELRMRPRESLPLDMWGGCGCFEEPAEAARG